MHVRYMLFMLDIFGKGQLIHIHWHAGVAVLPILTIEST